MEESSSLAHTSEGQSNLKKARARDTKKDTTDAQLRPPVKQQKTSEKTPVRSSSSSTLGHHAAPVTRAAHINASDEGSERRSNARSGEAAKRDASTSSSSFARPQHSHRGPPVRAALPVASSASASSPSSAPPSRLHHPFKANFNDHFETSAAALQDVLPFVNELRQLLRPSTPERLTIYDPYYCSGAVVQAWTALGVPHVLHENRDFYADIAKGSVPGPYDVLVTNPPFSDDHIWRLLDFLVTQNPLKPWAFVAPDYIAAKPQYKAWVAAHFTPTTTVPSPGPAGAVKGAVRRPPPPIPSIEDILPPLMALAEGATEDTGESPLDGAAPPSSPAAAAPASVGPEPFYIVPRVRYDYAHPLGVGHDHSHFKSMWYVWAGRHTSEVLRGVAVALSGRGRNAALSRSSSSSSAVSGGATASAPVAVVNGYQALVEGHYVTATDRRMNPVRRERLAPPARGGRGRR